MEKNNLKEFIELLKDLSEIFDNSKEISERKTILYFDALKKYNIRDIKISVLHLVKTRQFAGLPRPGEISHIIDIEFYGVDDEIRRI